MAAQQTGLLLIGLVAAGALAAGETPAARSRPPAARPHSEVVTRDGIEALEAELDRAVDRVSMPRVVSLLARGSARGYRLPGYGVVFVLSPRVLPGGDDVLVRMSGPRHHIELRTHPRPPGELPPEIETIEKRVIILQNETELARRAAEEDMARIVHDARLRLSQHEAQQHVHAAAPPLPPDAPPPPTELAPPDAPAAPPEPPQPTAAEAPPPPPWKYWFESGIPHEGRTAEAVIASVRQAVLEVLETRAALVPGLRPDELVTVAVDFEQPVAFAAAPRPQRTLVVRARAADIEARARAALAAEEFRRRVEVIEY